MQGTKLWISKLTLLLGDKFVESHENSIESYHEANEDSFECDNQIDLGVLITNIADPDSAELFYKVPEHMEADNEGFTTC